MKTVVNFNGTRCPSCRRMVRDASPTGYQGFQGFQDRTPRCSSCGYPLTLQIPAEVDARTLAERVFKHDEGTQRALQAVVDDAVRAIERDMVSPPRRRRRAPIGWKSLMVGIMIGVSVAGTLGHYFGGHF